MAALAPDGDRREQAYATNVIKPSRAADLEAAWAPRVHANRDQDWVVTLAGRQFMLPPYGWVAADGAGFLEYSARFGDGRRDFVTSPEYLYLEARGTAASDGGVAAAGQVIVLRGDRSVRVIPLESRTPVRVHLASLGLAGTAPVRVTYLTSAGTTDPGRPDRPELCSAGHDGRRPRVHFPTTLTGLNSVTAFMVP
jgi:hypothetical protein